MCDICGRPICPPACPSYNGRSAELGHRVGICRKCGRSIYTGESARQEFDSLVCGECSKAAAVFFIKPVRINAGEKGAI